MIIFLAGAVYGQINRFYDKVLQVEKELGVEADWVLQTGNFGVYPDPNRVSPTMRKRDNTGDFAKIYVNQEALPRKTLFVPGKHEDHGWIDWRISKCELELVPNLTILQNGYKTHIGQGDEDISIVGLGKVYSEKTYREGRREVPKRLSHYTKTEVERGCAQGPTDILMLHEPLLGDAKGLKNVCFAIRPKLTIHNKGPGHERPIWMKEVGGFLISLGEQEIVPIEWGETGYKFLLS